MEYSTIVTLIFNILCASSQIPHESLYIVGCFWNDTEAQLEFDGEEVLYFDFQSDKVETSIPGFMGPNPLSILITDIILHDAKKNRRLCNGILAYWTEIEKNPQEAKDAPDSTIYPSEDVELGVENTLICFVNHFYPPSIKVNWTKNGQVVTEGASLSRYYPNNDGTFHQFSMLTFTPQEWDIYTCTVGHSALEEPRTRIWEPDVSIPSFGPDVFCGVGLTVGLLGIAVGTFLIVKEHYRQ